MVYDPVKAYQNRYWALYRIKRISEDGLILYGSMLSWDGGRKTVPVFIEQIPMEYWPLIKPGRFFKCKANIAVETVKELVLSDFELMPELSPEEEENEPARRF